MKGKTNTLALPGNLFLAGAVAASAFLFCFCASETVAASKYEKPEKQAELPYNVPVLRVSSPQTAVYNGEPQPLSFYYEGEKTPEIVYYSSASAREKDEGGSSAVPVKAGVYYARIERPRENEGSPEEEFLAEYHILKRPVIINAGKNQEAFYNGDPKRVQVEAVPALPLSYSYYPNRELMETAVKAAKQAISSGDAASFSGSYRGYKRVDRAPIEQGTYSVWIFYPGDENHESAEAFVEFTILPPQRR